MDDPEVASKVNEEMRLKYRYLDLRRPEMARNLRVRSKAATATRFFMDEQGFLEVETPILFKSTPEGAREFLVPNRREPGTFYALPQSPQQFKQILMVGGVERYYQIARCFRDEDQRADRQLEFSQIDIEMSFIEREDIYNLVEGLLKRIWKTTLNIDVPTPFKRLTFQEAINRYGIDKPDTRFGMELVDFTEEFRGSKFKIFSGAVANQGVVKAINAKGLACVTQGQMDTMTEYAKSFGAKGLAFIKVEGGEWKSPIVRFFSDAEKAALTSKLAIEEGDLILFAADQWLTACEILGKIRLYCAEVLKGQGKLAIPADRFDFLWVVDFPLLSFDKEQNRWYMDYADERVLERRQRAFADHVDIGFDETAIGIISQAGIASGADQAVDAGAVHPDIEHGVQHAGHGFRRARTDGDEQGIARIAELFSGGGFETIYSLRQTVPQGVERARFAGAHAFAQTGRQDEGGRNRQPQRAHPRQFGRLGADVMRRQAASARRRGR